jgi:hypothetical protein
VQPSHGHDQTGEECYDTRQDAQHSREYFYEAQRERGDIHIQAPYVSLRHDRDPSSIGKIEIRYLENTPGEVLH